MTEFMACWSGNDPEGMLALCTEPWRNEPDLLKDILQDRTPESWELSGIIGIELPVAVVECDICTQPDGIEKHAHVDPDTVQMLEISIVDEDGNQVEPKATVDVSMKMKSLPEEAATFAGMDLALKQRLKRTASQGR